MFETLHLTFGQENLPFEKISLKFDMFTDFSIIITVILLTWKFEKERKRNEKGTRVPSEKKERSRNASQIIWKGTQVERVPETWVTTNALNFRNFEMPFH